MGDYTGFQLECTIRAGFREVFETHHRVGELWECMAAAFPMGALVSWADTYKHDFIPFGDVCYLPWEHKASYADGHWSVCCSLKDAGQIQKFVQTVLPLIASDVTLCFSQFEADDGPTHFVKHGAKLVRCGHCGKQTLEGYRCNKCFFVL